MIRTRTYRILERRTAKGLAQADVAALAGHGVTQAHVSKAERGLSVPQWVVQKIRLGLIQPRIMRDLRRAEEAQRAAERAADDEIGLLIETMPPSTAWAELRAAFRDRVLRYYDAGRMEEGDAVLQFLPNDEAQALLDEYFLDPDPKSEAA